MKNGFTNNSSDVKRTKYFYCKNCNRLHTHPSLDSKNRFKYICTACANEIIEVKITDKVLLNKLHTWEFNNKNIIDDMVGYTDPYLKNIIFEELI